MGVKELNYSNEEQGNYTMWYSLDILYKRWINRLEKDKESTFTPQAPFSQSYAMNWNYSELDTYQGIMEIA